jgi:transcriptional regulator with XRE-family HTH domain
MNFPNNLKVIRDKYRMSQEAFGTLMNATRQMINSYEQGNATPKIDFFLKLASITGLSIDYLFYKRLEEADIPSDKPGEVGESVPPYLRYANLFDIRELVQEVEALRQEVEELKKRG